MLLVVEDDKGGYKEGNFSDLNLKIKRLIQVLLRQCLRLPILPQIWSLMEQVFVKLGGVMWTMMMLTLMMKGTMMNTKKVVLIWMMSIQGPIKAVFAPDQ